MIFQTAEQFVRARSSSDPEEQRRASWGEADVEVWMDVVRRYPDYRVWVAHNKTVPLSVISVLASDPDPRVRDMVSCKRKLTADLLEKMSWDPHDSVRLNVARHRKTSMGTLRRLSQDSWEEVRRLAMERLIRQGGS